jgi:hypothetical protein
MGKKLYVGNLSKSRAEARVIYKQGVCWACKQHLTTHSTGLDWRLFFIILHFRVE